jgi:coatomer protein complex subunit gamma
MLTFVLYRCLDDVDDEVRDRAALYLRVFKEKPLADVYVKEGSSLDLIVGSISRPVQSPSTL